MTQEFQTLIRYTERLKERYLILLSAKNIFDRLNELLVINRVGKKMAKRNAEVFTCYRYFFFTVKEAIRCFFLIELAKFFEPHKNRKSLYIRKVIKFAEKNLSKITEQDYKKHYKKTTRLPLKFFRENKHLSRSDIRKIKNKLIGRNIEIKKLTTYRNQYLAHDDITKISVSLSQRDIGRLLSIVSSVINLLYRRLNFSSFSSENFKQQPRREVDVVVDIIASHYKNWLPEKIKKRMRQL